MTKPTSKSLVLIITLGVIVLLIVLYFAMWYWNQNNHKKQLVLYGNVDIRQVDLGFRVSGRIEKMLFEEGDEVKVGDIIATLDKAPYEADLATAKAQFSQAKANYAKLLHGSRPQEIEESRANVQERQAIFENANIIFKRQSEQIKVGATSQQAYDDAFAQKNEAEALLTNAKEALSLAEEGFRQEDIDAGRAAMEAAKAQVESAKLNLEDTNIFSPSNGIIMTRVREPGAIIAPLSVVYTLSLYHPIWVRAYVSEIDLGRIKPGMEALVTTDTHPNKPFIGQIGFISPQAEFTPKTVETTELRTDLVYRLRIIVDDPKNELRQGMPVTVKMRIAE
jgi:HlyD family secretion protein